MISGGVGVLEITSGSGLAMLQLVGIIPTSRQNLSFMHKPTATQKVTYFLMARNSAATTTVQIGANGETFYFTAEELIQPLQVVTENSVSDSDSDDSWVNLESH